MRCCRGEILSPCDTRKKTKTNYSPRTSNPFLYCPPENTDAHNGHQLSRRSWIQTKNTVCVSISPKSHWSCKDPVPDLLHYCILHWGREKVLLSLQGRNVLEDRDLQWYHPQALQSLFFLCSNSLKAESTWVLSPIHKTLNFWVAKEVLALSHLVHKILQGHLGQTYCRKTQGHKADTKWHPGLLSVRSRSQQGTASLLGVLCQQDNNVLVGKDLQMEAPSEAGKIKLIWFMKAFVVPKGLKQCKLLSTHRWGGAGTLNAVISWLAISFWLSQTSHTAVHACWAGLAWTCPDYICVSSLHKEREPANAPCQGIGSLLKTTTWKTSPYLILTAGHGTGKELPDKQKCPLGQSWGAARPGSLQNVPSGQSLQRDWPRP